MSKPLAVRKKFLLRGRNFEQTRGGQPSVSTGISRAASVLLSDPCFQLHSIQHLLGEGGDSSSSSAAVTATATARPVIGSLGSSVAAPIPSAAGNPERKHFSLHAYTDYISEEEKQKVELMLAFLTDESKQAAASTAVSTTASCCCCHIVTDQVRQDQLGDVGLQEEEVKNRN
ncbi:E3 ubiquitin-protein ligase RNF123-like [Morone saxatilis]|uniref:E3 ubiquitin-protein ligase RNF123-like n=1 Tax=Morone saxatilis TaxID=34816 RepID=UPI0015E21D55|nr:E3 ubiquitin-protein ligase RNF123-like [Morone saxatilis]